LKRRTQCAGFSSPRREPAPSCLGDRSWLPTQEREGRVAAYPDGRRHCVCCARHRRLNSVHGSNHPISSTTIPDNWVSKRTLHRCFTNGYRDAVCMTNSPQIHNLMKSFDSMPKNFNIPSPKSQSSRKDPAPKARHPLLSPDASPHANWLARPPRFPEICEEDEDAPEDNNRCQSPAPATRRKKPRSTSSASQHHVLARPSSSPPPSSRRRS
jgi:hypothetical protein